MFRLLRLFRKRFSRQDGSATIEFVIIFPAFVLILISTFEVGMAMTRLTMLEHALDVTVRDIRLGTGEVFKHDDIRDSVCDNAAVLKNCTSTLQLELVRIDPANWVMPVETATCIDRGSDAEPAITFNNGNANDIMYVRACFVVDPIFPTMGLGSILDVDATGAMQLVAMSAFSQEPN
ncbi:MAG: pilus assembly protein [Litoreibacter sp.]|nr:pilus assembly protein [Litoreibacter sp.]